jgi:hypothetical protein
VKQTALPPLPAKPRLMAAEEWAAISRCALGGHLFKPHRVRQRYCNVLCYRAHKRIERDRRKAAQ